ncbi:protein Shroom-like [Diaphorina citri]|uniref:Protein Shroom-like n=1 Tax=Diaphorina citri TaxID=121845 RepID=A0A3Q0JI89_DIACI|nr:protein Shroom-like [Diaphorina citri]
MPGRLAELSGAVETHQSQHLSLAMVKRERIPRSRSDISNAGSNESGYSSSSLNVSSPASSPTRTPVDLSERGIEPGDPPNYRTQCVETQCNLGARPPLQCTSQSYKPVHRPIPLSRLGSCSVSDASSQTDLTSSGPASLSPPPPPDPLSPLSRQLEEEIECDKLSRDLASVLPPNDRLHGILGDGDSTFNASVLYGSLKLSNGGRSWYPDNLCDCVLLEHQKKAELMSRLDSKLTLLRSVQVDLNEESRGNDRLGEALATRLASEARPAETAKYKLHVQEVGHITSLLLGLSGRLARAENALIGLREDHCDRKSLEEKRDKLASQLEEAKELKENIDRRSTNVATLLRKYLSSEEFADYNHFINMKAKLLVDAREISDKIQLGEEQLAALQETMEGES